MSLTKTNRKNSIKWPWVGPRVVYDADGQDHTLFMMLKCDVFFVKEVNQCEAELEFTEKCVLI